jgi:hypothetical protein
MLLAEWPEDLRRAVELYYYADLPAGQIGVSPGAAKVSLHKARRRLRAHITAHRPDLIPVTSRRTSMTTVRIACAEPHLDTTLDGSTAIGHILVVLADDPGHRAMALWLRARQSMALWRILGRPPRDSEPGQPQHDARAGDLPAREFSPEDLASRLLAAAGGTVSAPHRRTETQRARGPNRGGQPGRHPAGHGAPPGGALALAAALDVPVRVPDTLMDPLAVPVTGGDLLGPFISRTPARPSGPRSGPRNLAFADGLHAGGDREEH